MSNFGAGQKQVSEGSASQAERLARLPFRELARVVEHDDERLLQMAGIDGGEGVGGAQGRRSWCNSTSAVPLAQPGRVLGLSSAPDEGAWQSMKSLLTTLARIPSLAPERGLRSPLPAPPVHAGGERHSGFSSGRVLGYYPLPGCVKRPCPRTTSNGTGAGGSPGRRRFSAICGSARAVSPPVHESPLP
jgi:hypothetical protein